MQLRIQTFTARHYRPAVHSMDELAAQTDKGIVLASALVEGLRRQGVLLPTVNVIERICAEAITRANRRIYEALSDPLTDDHRRHLDDLLTRRDNGKKTWLAWLRQAPAKPNSRYNGVPVVNIATPNGAGLSHNKFTDFDVGQNGLILNNATGKTQSTQLSGIIIGNPNLKNGAASTILNEVTSNNPTQLRGYTEVAGQAAHMIVAAPGGITCAGCGFINTPHATFTTGKPILNGERLQGYDVNGGEIAIEGAGLNASNVDRFELITRSAKLNAETPRPGCSSATGSR